MELNLKPEPILESLQHMEHLIEGRFADKDLARAKFAEVRLLYLLESQLKVKGFRELLLFCEPGALFADELCGVLGNVDDFLIWAKAEIDIANRQL